MSFQHNLGVDRGLSCENFVCTLCFLETVVDQLAQGPVSPPAEVHRTAIFTLQNGIFSRFGGVSPGNFKATFRDDTEKLETQGKFTNLRGKLESHGVVLKT